MGERKGGKGGETIHHSKSEDLKKCDGYCWQNSSDSASSFFTLSFFLLSLSSVGFIALFVSVFTRRMW